jgi:hypothetical protein
MNHDHLDPTGIIASGGTVQAFPPVKFAGVKPIRSNCAGESICLATLELVSNESAGRYLSRHAHYDIFFAIGIEFIDTKHSSSLWRTFSPGIRIAQRHLTSNFVHTNSNPSYHFAPVLKLGSIWYTHSTVNL